MHLADPFVQSDTKSPLRRYIPATRAASDGGNPDPLPRNVDHEPADTRLPGRRADHPESVHPARPAVCIEPHRPALCARQAADARRHGAHLCRLCHAALGRRCMGGARERGGQVCGARAAGGVRAVAAVAQAGGSDGPAGGGAGQPAGWASGCWRGIGRTVGGGLAAARGRHGDAVGAVRGPDPRSGVDRRGAQWHEHLQRVGAGGLRRGRGHIAVSSARPGRPRVRRHEALHGHWCMGAPHHGRRRAGRRGAHRAGRRYRPARSPVFRQHHAA